MKYALLIALSLLSSCIRSSPSSGKQVAVDPTKNYEEDLSALRNSYTSIKEEQEIEPKVEQSLSFVGEEPKNDNAAIANNLQKLKERNESLVEARGYRISIYSGNTRGEFESAKAYSLQHFPELEVYETYSQPTYRIKVGDFLNKMDAERYYAELVSRFPTAKIMADKISLKNSLNIKF